MRFFINFFFLLFIVFLFSSKTNSNENIVYIDLEKIMSQSKAGISISTQLEKMHLKNIENFKKIENELKEEEAKILSQKNILDNDEYKKKINELRNKTNNYRSQRNKDIDDLTKKRLDATNKLLNEINPVLINYSNENSISIIFQKKNIIIGKSELDITDEIQLLVDAKISKIKLN